MQILLKALLTLSLALAALWGCGALWFRLPLGEFGRGAAAAAFAASMLAAILLIWWHRPLLSAAILAPLWAGLLLWWATILPSNDRDWQPDMAHVARAEINGDTLTVWNVRNFTWRSETDFDQRWETRHYHLRQLRGADLFLSYWSGPLIAHAIVSFTFADSDPLAFSIEIRKEKGEAYSSTAGFFKSYELAIIAADERDVVKVRSTVRGEDVRLFRLDMQPQTVRGLLGEYVALANRTSAHPRWYNTLTANCTTMIFGMARRMDPRIRMDWRILLPGKLPSYLREREFVTGDVPLEQLIAASHIGPRAAAPPSDPGFSQRIREGVPKPQPAAPH